MIHYSVHDFILVSRGAKCSPFCCLLPSLVFKSANSVWNDQVMVIGCLEPLPHILFHNLYRHRRTNCCHPARRADLDFNPDQLLSLQHTLILNRLPLLLSLTSPWEKLSIFKLVSVETRLEQSSGKSSPMSMELTQPVPILAPVSCRWRGLRCTTMRPWGCPQSQRPGERSLYLVESLSQGPSWWTLSLAPWTVWGLDNFVFGQSGAGNNWAKGHYTEGKKTV